MEMIGAFSPKTGGSLEPGELFWMPYASASALCIALAPLDNGENLKIVLRSTDEDLRHPALTVVEAHGQAVLSAGQSWVMEFTPDENHPIQPTLNEDVGTIYASESDVLLRVASERRPGMRSSLFVSLRTFSIVSMHQLYGIAVVPRWRLWASNEESGRDGVVPLFQIDGPSRTS